MGGFKATAYLIYPEEDRLECKSVYFVVKLGERKVSSLADT